MTTPTTPTSTKSRHLTEEEKAVIKNLWESGEVTLNNLAFQLGRSKSAIVKYIARAGFVRGVKKAEEEAVRESTKTGVEDEVLKALRIKETQDESYKIGTAIHKLIGAEIMRCRTENVSQAKGFDAYRALLVAAQALKTAQQVRERSLGMDKTEDPIDKPLPTLGIHTVTDKQIREIQEANKVTNAIDDMIEGMTDEMRSPK